MVRVNLLGAKEPAARGGVFSGGGDPGVPSEPLPAGKAGIL